MPQNCRSWVNSPSQYSFEEFKNDVEAALVEKFGRESVKRKNKCLTVLGNTNRIETDVVPTWNYRRYEETGGYVEGCQFRADSGDWCNNYPKQHIDNGKDKNKITSKRFKRLTRICRNLRYKMIDDEQQVNDSITSFLIECLIWNVPNNLFNDHETWNDRLKESIRFLYHQTKEKADCKEWGEVSELLYLFHSQRKWTVEDVNKYLVQVWNYMEYEN